MLFVKEILRGNESQVMKRFFCRCVRGHPLIVAPDSGEAVLTVSVPEAL